MQVSQDYQTSERRRAGNNDDQPLQLFIALADFRNDFINDQKMFLVKAKSHREAWAVAREATRTGQGAFIRDTHDPDLLHPFRLPPNDYTVKKVLSANRGRRGRPPKITTDDLYALAQRRGVAISREVRALIQDELRTD